MRVADRKLEAAKSCCVRQVLVGKRMSETVAVPVLPSQYYISNSVSHSYNVKLIIITIISDQIGKVKQTFKYLLNLEPIYSAHSISN